MKNLLLTFVLSIFALSIFAQNGTVESKRPCAKYATDQTQSGTTAKYVTFYVDVTSPYYYNIIADIDSSGNGTDVTLTIEGSDDGTNYYTVNNGTTYGVTADTVVQFTNLSTVTVSNGAYTVRSIDTVATYTVTSTSDSISGGRVADDSIVYPAIYTDKTLSYSAQTITKTEPRVMWKYLRLKAVSTSGGGCILANTSLCIAISKED